MIIMILWKELGDGGKAHYQSVQISDVDVHQLFIESISTKLHLISFKVTLFLNPDYTQRD